MKTFKEMVPEWLHDPQSVFKAEGFNELPPRQTCVSCHWIGGRLQTMGRGTYNTAVNRGAQSSSIFLWWKPESWADYTMQVFILFFTKSKNGKLCPIHDCWKLNVMMVQNWTPLPLIKEVIDGLHGDKVFSKIGVHWGFNNIHIKEGDEETVAFIMSERLNW